MIKKWLKEILGKENAASVFLLSSIIYNHFVSYLLKYYKLFIPVYIDNGMWKNYEVILGSEAVNHRKKLIPKLGTSSIFRIILIYH